MIQDRAIDQETLQNDTDFINLAVMLLHRRNRRRHLLHTRRANQTQRRQL